MSAITAIALFSFLLVPFVWSQTVTYIPGELPLILSVPHGGALKPVEFPDRHYGCFIDNECVFEQDCTPQSSSCKVSTLKDAFTRDIGMAVSDFIFRETELHPYVVINELHRIKLDANREINEATLNNPNAIAAFNEYNQRVEEAINSINARALFIDIHGQTHPENWVELGYRLSSNELNTGTLPKEKCSIRRLQEDSCGSNVTCSYLYISGQHSLGAYLESTSEEYSVVPSPENESPGSGNYFAGGYNTDTYGSDMLGVTDAIQVEIPRPIRFSEDGFDRNLFAEQLGKSLLEFLEDNGYLGDSPCSFDIQERATSSPSVSRCW